MSEHVRRGIVLEENVDMSKDVTDDGFILHEHYCGNCDTPIRLRAREGEHNHVRLGCDCGKVELALRIADIIEGDIERPGIESWERRDPPEKYVQ